MNKFRFYYSALIKILLAVVIVVAAAGLAFNVISVADYFKADVFKAVIYLVLTVLNAALFILALSVAFYGTYKIKNGFLYSYFGIIFTKTPVKNIVQITHFKKSDKLVMYFKDEKYSVAIIPPQKYDDFTAALLKENPDIIYDAKTEENL